MPEFRFRRKKGSNRRTTVCNAEETARQIEAAKQLMESSLPESEPLSPIKTNGTMSQPNGTSNHTNATSDLTNGIVNGITNGLSGSSKESVASANIGEDPADDKGEGLGDQEEIPRELRDEALLFAASSRGCRKRSSFVQEREMFLELLKAKYPEQACTLDIGLSNLEEGVGVAGAGDLSMFKEKPVININGIKVSSPDTHDSHHSNGVSLAVDEEDEICAEMKSIMKDTKTEEGEEQGASPDDVQPNDPPRNYGECLYLRHGKSLRHCPMPSPITLSTIKNLFLNMFDLTPTFFSSSSSACIYLQDKKTKMWNKLENASTVTDHCTLLLADSALSHTSSNPASQADSDINMPLSQLTPLETSPKFDSSADGVTPTENRNGLWRSGHTHLVQNLSILPDSLPLQKNPPSLLPHTYPSPASFSSSSSSSSSPNSNTAASPAQGEKVLKEKILTQAQELQASLTDLKSDLSNLRQTHGLKMAELQASMGRTSQRIVDAIVSFSRTTGSERREDSKAVAIGNTCWKRSEVAALKESYTKYSDSTLHHLDVLECAVEEMRLDVVRRRCRVVEEEVNVLSSSVTNTTDIIKDIKAQFQPLKDKMNSVMEEELKILVREEEFVKEEGVRLEEASDKCAKLMKTLLTLLQYASLQSQRTPPNLNFPVVPNPDRSGLIENIGAISPNPEARMESLAKAEELRKKKKELNKTKKVGIRAFEEELKAKKKQLHRAVDYKDIDNRREMKVKAMYTEEKYKNGAGKMMVQKTLERSGSGEGVEGRKKSLDMERRSVEMERKKSMETERKKSVEMEGKKSVEERTKCHKENLVKGVPRPPNSRSYQWQYQEDKDPAVPDLPRSPPEVATLMQSQASQDSHASLPITLTRSAGTVSTAHNPPKILSCLRSDGQAYSNSQPEYFESASFETTQPTSKLKPKRHQLGESLSQEVKRKSISYVGEFSEVEVYYDTLQRKRREASKDSGLSLPNSTTSEVATGMQTRASFASKVSIPESNASAGGFSKLSNAASVNSFGINGVSGVSLTPDSNGIDDTNTISVSSHQPQKRPSSLVASSALSYPASLRQSLADASSKRKSSPGDVNSYGSEASAQLRRPGLRAPAGNVPQSLTSTYSKLAPSTTSSAKKKLQGSVLPPRYGRALGEQYHNSSGSPKMSRELPDVPASSPHESKLGSRPSPRKSSVTAPPEDIVGHGRKGLETNRLLQSPASDSSASTGISKLSRMNGQPQNSKESNRNDDLANIFDSDTLPAPKKKDEQRDKEAPPVVLKSSHMGQKSVGDSKQPKKSKISLFGRQKDSRSKTSADNAQRNPQKQQYQLSHPPQGHPPQQRPAQYQHQPLPLSPPQHQSSSAGVAADNRGSHPQLRPQAMHSHHGIPQPLKATHISGLGTQAAGERRDSSHFARSGGSGTERPPVIGREKTTSSFPGRLGGSPQKKSYKSSAESSLPMYTGPREDRVAQQQQQQQMRHPRLQQMSGIPMRATKSAQQPSVPVSEDIPITSYPRTQASAMRLRSSSNGQVMKVTHEQQQPPQQQQQSLNFSRPIAARPGAKAGTGGAAPSLRAPHGRSGGGAAYMKSGGYGGAVDNVAGTTKGIMVGSLV